MCFEYEFLIFFYASNPRETLCLNVKKNNYAIKATAPHGDRM